MNRTTAAFFAVAGLSALIRFGVEYADPAYYDPKSLLDYGAVAGLTAAYVATGIALFLLWRAPPVARGSLFLLLAGLGAVTAGLGNLFEDSFKVESAAWAFFGGGLVMMLSLIVAGIAAVRADTPRRTSGLLLLAAFPGGLLGFGLAMMGVAWIGFAYWIMQHRNASMEPATVRQ